MDLTEPVAAALLVRMRHTPASVTGYAVPSYTEHKVCKCSLWEPDFNFYYFMRVAGDPIVLSW